MKLPSPKVIVKSIVSAARRNDTKIFAVISGAASIAATKLAVDAGERIAKKKEEAIADLEEGEELTRKDIADITLGELGGVIASEAVALLGIVGLYKSGAAKVAAAMTAAEFSHYQAAKAMKLAKKNNEEDSENNENSEKKTLYNENNERAAQAAKILSATATDELWNRPFTVKERYTGKVIKNITMQKLIVATYTANNMLSTTGEVYLDFIVSFLGGGRLYPAYENKFVWQRQSYFDLFEYPQNHRTTVWFEFSLKYDEKTGGIELGYITPPDYIGNDDLIEDKVEADKKRILEESGDGW